MVERAPWAALIVITAVFVLLFCMTGSLVVPLKALLINGFSLIASLGVTSWLFEHGHLGLPQTPRLQTFNILYILLLFFQFLPIFHLNGSEGLITLLLA